MKTMVVSGTPQQFESFCHIFGPDFQRVATLQDLKRRASGLPARPLVLLVGTWAQDGEALLMVEWLRQPSAVDGKRNGQAFAMFGSFKTGAKT